MKWILWEVLHFISKRAVETEFAGRSSQWCTVFEQVSPLSRSSCASLNQYFPLFAGLRLQDHLGPLRTFPPLQLPQLTTLTIAACFCRPSILITHVLYVAFTPHVSSAAMSHIQKLPSWLRMKRFIESVCICSWIFHPPDGEVTTSWKLCEAEP